MKTLLIAFALMGAAAVGVAQSSYTMFSTKSLAVPGVAANGYSIITANSSNAGAPVVTFLSATSDLTTSVVQFYASTNDSYQIGAQGSGNRITCASTNGLDINQPILIQHMNPPNSEILFAGGAAQIVSGNFRIICTTSSVQAINPGDLVLYQYPVGSIPVGAATITANSVGIYSGQRKKPLLMVVNGTSASKINTVTSTFIPGT